MCFDLQPVWQAQNTEPMKRRGDVARTEIPAWLREDVEALAIAILADGKPVPLSTSWEPYDLTGGTRVVLPEGGPRAGAGAANRMAEIGVTARHVVEQPEPRQRMQPNRR